MKLFQGRLNYKLWIAIFAIIIVATTGIVLITNPELVLPSKEESVQTGRYVTEDGMTWVVIEENQQFIFIRGAMSYAPSGSYIIDRDKLILQVNNDEMNTIIFKIQDDKLIFKSGGLEGDLIKKDTILKFDKEGFPINTFSIQQFEEAMKGKGYIFEIEDVEPFLFPATRKRMVIGEESMDIYLFSSEDEMENEASYIDSGGCSYIKDSNAIEVSWVSYPHFFKMGNMIVQYIGEDNKIISDLKDILGEQFAGYNNVETDSNSDTTKDTISDSINQSTNDTNDNNHKDSQTNYINIIEGRRQEFLDRLDNIQKELDNLPYKKDSDAGVTNAMKDYYGVSYEMYDKELNGIYALLREELSPEAMEDLKTKQLQWIKEKETKAKKEESLYKGGTFEFVAGYVSLYESTKERCYELVNEYMTD